MKIRTVPLSELGEIVSGSTPKTGVPQFWNGDIPWITPADLSDHEGIYFHGTPKKISKAGFDSCSAAMLPAGSILFSSRAPIGHCALTAYPACTNQGFKNIVPNKRLDPVYGYFALRFLTPAIVAMGRGATFAEINKELFESVQVPYCDLPEQRRIARRLEQADRLRRTRRYALEITDTFLPAAFLEVFGETGDRFQAVAVDELAADKPHSIRTGPFGSQLLHSEFTDRGIAVLGIDNAVNNEFAWSERRFITPEKYEQLKRYTVFPGDVIITIMGTCGRCAIVPDDVPTAINTKHLCCITLDQNRCLPIYLHGAFLFHPFVRRQQQVATKGSIMDGLNMEIIKCLRIPLPPLQLQQKFAALVERVERLRAVQREAHRQAEHLFQTLLHRAFFETDSTNSQGQSSCMTQEVT